MSTAPPSWSHCGRNADPISDPVGCSGIQIPGYRACLAHLSRTDRVDYFDSLTAGQDIDHRGTTFSGQLLSDLLAALTDSGAGIHPCLGNARFEAATFESGWDFQSVRFQGEVSFESATFKGVANFSSAEFQGDAFFSYARFDVSDFGSAVFKARVEFRGTQFGDAAVFTAVEFNDSINFISSKFMSDAIFASATFKGGVMLALVNFVSDANFEESKFFADAVFMGAEFNGSALFRQAIFGRSVAFSSSIFHGSANFSFAEFELASYLGPLACGGMLNLSGVTFGKPVIIEAAAHYVRFNKTRWASTAEIRLRYATVDLTSAFFEYPVIITREMDPFTAGRSGSVLNESFFSARGDSTVRVSSLRGVDAAHLVLSNVELSRCLFVGAVHLDQLRIEGACSFDTVPKGVYWLHALPARFTQRFTLAEEHHWRVTGTGTVTNWNRAVLGARKFGPAQLEPVYRALRKSFEDNKNEPGAADFYYGEMEMRRHNRVRASRAERGLLTAYWLLSGYGLRASRAFGWLAAAMLITILFLMGVGLPSDSVKQEVTGTMPSRGSKVTLEIDKENPRNPKVNRFTGERFEKALNVTLNSVIFRTSGQDLTTSGTYIEMGSRIAEPALLALGVIAIRGRIKR
ncbi:pentapeptide repeat-containing protein [Streptomyces sp. NPDC048188]|uniref:pentapeptide repeat-containing protein n=1 Tax=Streptomyces sp. NPDC048188 TaxID=3155749 RepID=UPI0034160C2E